MVQLLGAFGLLICLLSGSLAGQRVLLDSSAIAGFPPTIRIAAFDFPPASFPDADAMFVAESTGKIHSKPPGDSPPTLVFDLKLSPANYSWVQDIVCAPDFGDSDASG